MWQKDKGEYHLLLNYSSETQDGSFRATACEGLIQSKKKNQSLFPLHGEGCVICEGVWRLVFTSVDDAKTTLKHTENLTVMRRALELTKSVTLKKAIEARVRKLEKEASHASI